MRGRSDAPFATTACGGAHLDLFRAWQGGRLRFLRHAAQPEQKGVANTASPHTTGMIPPSSFLMSASLRCWMNSLAFDLWLWT